MSPPLNGLKPAYSAVVLHQGYIILFNSAVLFTELRMDNHKIFLIKNFHLIVLLFFFFNNQNKCYTKVCLKN